MHSARSRGERSAQALCALRAAVKTFATEAIGVASIALSGEPSSGLLSENTVESGAIGAASFGDAAAESAIVAVSMACAD
jgi:hypothetical protein